jgi:hypothetical protein
VVPEGFAGVEGVSLVKRALMGLYLRGWINFRTVEWAFRVLPLKHK